MAAAGGRTLGRSSFSRATSNLVASSSGASGVKIGPNGASFVSSGIPDLDSKQLLAQTLFFFY
jgi:elongator complex protein 4